MLSFAFIVCLFLVGIEAEQIDQTDAKISNQTGAQRFRRWTSHCSYGGYYCGSELSSMGYSNAYTDYLYRCENNGHVGTQPKRCFDGCHHDYQRSASHCHCRPGGTYCGYELQSMNFRSYIDGNALYRCDNLHGVSQLRRCSQRCQTNNNGNAQCPYDPQPIRTCSIGTHYCGSQLRAMGRYRSARSQVIYRCANYRGTASPVSFCYNGCVGNTGSNARCRSPCEGLAQGMEYTQCMMRLPPEPMAPQADGYGQSDILGGDVNPTDDATDTRTDQSDNN